MSRSIRDWAVVSFPGKKADTDFEAKKKRAHDLGLQWPPAKNTRGKPSRDRLWQRLLYTMIRENKAIPAAATAKPPDGWCHPMTLEQAFLQDQEVQEMLGSGPAEEVEPLDVEDGGGAEERRAKRRKYVQVPKFVKHWFLDWAELKKKELGWTREQSFARAQVLVPELLGESCAASMRKWSRSPESLGSNLSKKAGRPGAVKAAHLPILSETVMQLCSEIPLTSVHYQQILGKKLLSLGVTWTPSLSWTRRFLEAGGLSYKRPGQDLQSAHDAPTREAWTANLKLKLAWTAAEWDVDKRRILNVDETCLLLLPALPYGWSKRGEKSRQLVADKQAITASVVLSMAEDGPAYTQLIFKGLTDACHPAAAASDEVQSDTMVCHTDTKWQTSESWLQLLGWIDSKMNPGGQDQPWLLLADLASVHRAQDVRAATPGHIKVVFVPAGASSYLQM